MMRLVYCGILLLGSLCWGQAAFFNRNVRRHLVMSGVPGLRLVDPAAADEVEAKLKLEDLERESATGDPSDLKERFLKAIQKLDFKSFELSVAAAGVTAKGAVDQDGEVEAGVGIGAGPASVELSVSEENTSLKGEFNFDFGLLRLTTDATKIFYFDQPHNRTVVEDVNNKQQLEDFIDSHYNAIFHTGGRLLLFSSDYWVYQDGAFVVKTDKSKGLGPFKYVTTKELIGDEMQRTGKKLLFTPKIKFTLGTVDVGMKAVIDLSKTKGWSKEYDLMSGEISGEVPSSGPRGKFTRLNSAESWADYIKHRE